jgi:hypothetical protein
MGGKSGVGDGSYVTTQGTSKDLKLGKLLAAWTMILGFLLMFANTTFGAVVVGIAAVWGLTVHVKTWWRHS